MACRLVGAKPLSEPMLKHCSFGHQQTEMKVKQNSYICIQENAFANVVCEMAVIFVSASMC